MIATGVENASQKFRGIVYDRALKVNRWWYVSATNLASKSAGHMGRVRALRVAPDKGVTARSMRSGRVRILITKGRCER